MTAAFYRICCLEIQRNLNPLVSLGRRQRSNTSYLYGGVIDDLEVFKLSSVRRRGICQIVSLSGNKQH